MRDSEIVITEGDRNHTISTENIANQFETDIAGILKTFRKSGRDSILELVDDDRSFSEMGRTTEWDKDFVRNSFRAFKANDLAFKNEWSTSEAYRTFLGLQVSNLIEESDLDPTSIGTALQTSERFALFNRLGTDFTVTELADELEVSPSYFHSTGALEHFEEAGLMETEGERSHREYFRGSNYGTAQKLVESIGEEILRYRVGEGFSSLWEDIENSRFKEGLRGIDRNDSYFPAYHMAESNGIAADIDVEGPTSFHSNVLSRLKGSDGFSYQELVADTGWTRNKVETVVGELEEAELVEIDGNSIYHAEHSSQEQPEGWFRDYRNLGKTNGNGTEAANIEEEPREPEPVETSIPETNGHLYVLEGLEISNGSIDDSIDEINEMLSAGEEKLMFSKLAKGQNWAISLGTNYELNGGEPFEGAEYVLFDPEASYQSNVTGFKAGEAVEYLTEEQVKDAVF